MMEINCWNCLLMLFKVGESNPPWQSNNQHHNHHQQQGTASVAATAQNNTLSVPVLSEIYFSCQTFVSYPLFIHGSFSSTHTPLPD